MTVMAKLTRQARQGLNESLKTTLRNYDITNFMLVEPLKIVHEQENREGAKRLLGALDEAALEPGSMLEKPLRDILPAVAVDLPDRVLELTAQLKDAYLTPKVTTSFARGDKHDKITALLEKFSPAKADRVCPKILKARPTPDVLKALQDARADWAETEELFRILDDRGLLEKNPVSLVRTICDIYGVSASGASDVASKALCMGHSQVADVIFDYFNDPQPLLKPKRLRNALEDKLDAEEIAGVLRVLYNHDLTIEDKRFFRVVVREVADHPEADALVSALLDHYEPEDKARAIEEQTIRNLIRHQYDLETLEKCLDRADDRALRHATSLEGAIVEHEHTRELLQLFAHRESSDNTIRRVLLKISEAETKKWVAELDSSEITRLVKLALQSDRPLNYKLDILLNYGSFEADRELLCALLETERAPDSDENVSKTLKLLREHGINLDSLEQSDFENMALTADHDKTLELLKGHYDLSTFEFKLRLNRGHESDVRFLKKYLNNHTLPDQPDIASVFKLDPDLAAQMLEQGVRPSVSELTLLVKKGSERVLEALRENKPGDHELMATLQKFTDPKTTLPRRAIARLFSLGLPFEDPPPNKEKGYALLGLEMLIEHAAQAQNEQPYYELIRAAFRQGAQPGLNEIKIALKHRQGLIIRALLNHQELDPNDEAVRTCFVELLKQACEEHDTFEVRALRAYLRAGGTLPVELIEGLSAGSELRSALKPALDHRQQALLSAKD